MDDQTLRGSTTYPESALKSWKQSKPLTGTKIAAIVLSVISISFTALLLCHATIRRAPWKRWGQPKQPQDKVEPKSTITSSGVSPVPFEVSVTAPKYSLDGGRPTLKWKDSEATLRGQASNPALRNMQSDATLRGNNDDIDVGSNQSPHLPSISAWDEKSLNDSKKSAYVVGVKEIPKRPVLQPGVSLTATGTAKPPPKQRIDYLAGLVALASLLVTVIHFGLTFVPALVEPGAAVHYQSEVFAEKTIAPLFLTFSWVGIFFTTSTRFLVANYLKNGDLQNIAEKTVGRTPRLMIPVAAIALLEYFVMNCGGTTWLEYLPSITWSTWPYTTMFPTFGDFFSEVLELLYLIPNAAPQITFHYCTGVLWTIPVQLQGTWLMLLGVIVIREIKTPWKRFAYYLFCIVTNWYARSWGMFLWLGLIITDLDVTYHYKTWIYARPGAHYTIIFGLFLVTALGFSPDIASQWQPWNFSIEENNIHPDQLTGQPIGQTDNAGYPAYFIPRFSALVFVTGFQMMVELSTVLQSILSFPLLMKLFPHILTIYLVHGMVFWTLGSWICVTLASIGIPYWANLMVVAVCCYAAIFFSLPILTPVIESLGRHITSQIWEFAHRGGAPRRRSLYPFPKDVFFDAANFKKTLEGDREVVSDLERATKDASADEEAIRKEQFPRLDEIPEMGGEATTPTLPVTTERDSRIHFMPNSRPESTNRFQDELALQRDERNFQGENYFRREMTQQRISRIESIGSNNPFRDSFKDEIAELDKIWSIESTQPGRGYQKSVTAMGTRYLQETDNVGQQRTKPQPPNPITFREDVARQRSASATNGNTSHGDGRNRPRSVSASAFSLVSDASSNNPSRNEMNREPWPQYADDFPQPPQLPKLLYNQKMPRRPANAYQQSKQLPGPPRSTQFKIPSDQNELRPMRPRVGEPGQSSPSGWNMPPGWDSPSGWSSPSGRDSPSTGRATPADRRVSPWSYQVSLRSQRDPGLVNHPRSATLREGATSRRDRGPSPNQMPLHPNRDRNGSRGPRDQQSPQPPFSGRKGFAF
jgi:hypothetical protein